MMKSIAALTSCFSAAFSTIQRSPKVTSIHKTVIPILILLMSLLSLTFPLSAEATTTTLYVDPATSKVLVDKTFTINISIANVTNLYGWEFKLYYNNTMLNGTGIIEGPFLSTSGSTFFNVSDFNDAYNVTHGRVWATGVLLGNVSGVNGSGVLASVTFMCKEFGSSILQLVDTTLGDPEGAAIIHTAVGGSVETWPRNIAIKSVTPSTFEAYEGQVISIAVAVKNEGNYTETFNVTAYYDDNVIETKTLRDLAPWATRTVAFSWDTIGLLPDSNYTIKAEASVLPGETNTTDNSFIDGAVRIKTVVVKVVELIPCNQTGYPMSSFKIGSVAHFKVVVNNTAIGSLDGLIAINIYDAVGATIGVASLKESPMPQGESILILGITIPKSARVGNATVYASAFTDWPHLGGIPYCPERSATFELIGP
jgi:phage baseplate assembly protein W